MCNLQHSDIYKIIICYILTRIGMHCKLPILKWLPSSYHNCFCMQTPCKQKKGHLSTALNVTRFSTFKRTWEIMKNHVSHAPTTWSLHVSSVQKVKMIRDNVHLHTPGNVFTSKTIIVGRESNVIFSTWSSTESLSSMKIHPEDILIKVVTGEAIPSSVNSLLF